MLHRIWHVPLVFGLVIATGPGAAWAVTEAPASEPALAVEAVAEEPGPAAALPAPSAPPAKAPPSQEDLVRAQIDGTRWLLEFTPMAADGKAYKDTVRFDARRTGAERLVKQGFPETNYTLTLGDDGVAVWETMQSREEGGLVFWRGEFHGQTMRGILSKHPAEGPAEDYSFTGREEKGRSVALGGAPPALAPSAVSTLPAGSPAAPASAPTAAQSAPKKKKRGWW